MQQAAAFGMVEKKSDVSSTFDADYHIVLAFSLQICNQIVILAMSDHEASFTGLSMSEV